ncbi:hypothetical protein BKA65DRAFT_496693 [Rhexocercosporidium sp. MPI-PUGE-AT-0058]|nr:hypothetical protein BKA65DRAFT_496693 [Rhexocercosporidium sp. MPI-PUGE-AT-0058]
MLFDVFSLIWIVLIDAVACQDSSTTSSPPSATHTISVGAVRYTRVTDRRPELEILISRQDGLNFSPNQVFANKGDIIEYRFYPQNHSVARAAFGSEPCITYELTGPGRVGFWSEFHPVALVLSNPPIWRLLVNDTDPIFFYCSSLGACLEGMVGVINAKSTFTHAQQFNYTQNATLDFSPGEYFPKESRPSQTTTATGATYTPTPTPSMPSSSVSIAAETTSTSILASHPHSGNSRPFLDAGPIAGIVVGAIAVVALASALLYMCGRRQSVKEILQHQATAQSANHNSYQPTVSGISEPQYPNMQKTPVVAESRWVGTETESYRSLSPPADGQTGRMQTGRMTSQGHPSPPVGTQVVQPTPAYYSAHERAHAHNSVGLRPYNPAPQTVSNELHELASPDEMRPFQYTDSESGYVRPSDGGKLTETT